MMEHEQEIKELSDGAAKELYRLARVKNYPIVNYAGLDVFTEAFKRGGVPVRLDGKSKKACFDFKYNISGREYVASVERSYQQILDGSGKHISGSTRALISYIPRIIMNTEQVLYKDYGSKLSDRQRENFSIHFCNKFAEIVPHFHDVLREYFKNYHEHVLVSPEGGVSQLKKSDILPIILEEIDWDEYDEMLRDDYDNEDDLLAFKDFFNIMFFDELVGTRGYPLREVGSQQQSVDPVDMFVDGKDIVWRNMPVIE